MDSNKFSIFKFQFSNKFQNLKIYTLKIFCKLKIVN
jgi:hypothetical protein